MKRSALKIIALLAIPVMLFGLAGCYPDNTTSIDDYDIVVTNYDSGYNFSGIRTYIMPDTVIAVNDPDNPDNNFEYEHTYDNLILSELGSQFASLGYSRVYDTVVSRPDVGVLVSAVSTTYIGYYWADWYYYWGWYPYWPYEYDYGYGYDYPWGVNYNYTIGTVIVTMIDLRSRQVMQADSVKVVWMGAINGLVEGSNINNRIQKGIDQMFLQSPYL